MMQNIFFVFSFISETYYTSPYIYLLPPTLGADFCMGLVLFWACFVALPLAGAAGAEAFLADFWALFVSLAALKNNWLAY